MFIELVGSLRCVRAHEDSWLVAVADELSERDIVRGSLGCPICGAEYPILDGIAMFGADPHEHEAHATLEDDETALRCAALLALGDESQLAILTGTWAVHARAVRRLAPAHLLLVNPPRGLSVGSGTSALYTNVQLPLAGGAAAGIALDAENVERLSMDSVVRALRPRGRLIAPADTPQPQGVAELARDERDWVAEKPVSEIVQLRRT